MKKLFLFIPAVILVLFSCTKKSNPSCCGPTPTPTSSPYYFRFALGGASYNLKSDEPQYMTFYANEAGGYEMDTLLLWPSAGIRFTWHSGDTVKESDITALAGKTIYFNDTNIHPEVSFDSVAAASEWLSIDTGNTSYYVKINTVTFLKKDTTLGVPVRTYVLNGTCSAVLTDGTSTRIMSNGQFNYVISRQDH